MNDVERSSSRPSPLLPIVLLAASLLLALVAQISSVHAERTNLKTAIAALADSIQKREPMVRQSDELRARFEALVNDLLELAKIDPKAQAIVKKYDIQTPPPAPEAGK